MGQLIVGFGRRDITPPLGVPNLLGVTCIAEEIWDSLYVTAAVIRFGAECSVIIGCDLCGFYQESDRIIRNAVSAATEVPVDHVVLNASHTHSAAIISTELQRILAPHDIQIIDAEYVKHVKEQIVAATQEAASHAEPARLHFGRGRVEGVASNRRPKTPEGKTVHRYGQPPEELRRLPEGLIDPDVLMVRVDNLDGRPLGSFCNYACHPTAAGGDCHSWVSADFVGYGRLRIEAALAGTPCLFLQGCAGNIGTGKWVTGARRHDVETMGQRFADGALAALENTQPIAVNSLRIARLAVPVSFDAFLSVDELRRRMEDAIPSKNFTMIAHGDALVVARRVQDFEYASVAGIALGDLAIACLPAEVFIEFGLDIKRRSPFLHTLVSAYNDNSLQYIPTADAFPEGEYEVNGGWRYIAAGAGEILAENAVKLLTGLKDRS